MITTAQHTDTDTQTYTDDNREEREGKRKKEKNRATNARGNGVFFLLDVRAGRR
jgi:hypothetical protein